MEKLADSNGRLRDEIVKLKRFVDNNTPNSSEAEKKYGIALYMDELITRAFAVASQGKYFTDEEQAVRKAELMELTLTIIDEVFEEERK